jgi:hypothetical protein
MSNLIIPIVNGLIVGFGVFAIASGGSFYIILPLVAVSSYALGLWRGTHV